MKNAPAFDRRAHAASDRAIAARVWQGLLAQEEASRVFTRALVDDLAQLDAPDSVRRAAERVESDEARHVAICAHVVDALGFTTPIADVARDARELEGEAFEQSVAEVVVAGFAVGETMSVGGFVAARGVSREPLARWALAEIARDEVRHGAFGEEAARWLLRHWSAERRRTLWPACVRMMEDIERRAGGPLADHAHDGARPFIETLGAPTARTCGKGLLRAIPRFVLPRLARLGVLPPTS